jgi:hypothetical protein
MTFHVPPSYRGKWEPMADMKGDLEPLHPTYVKDPEINVRNCSNASIDITPEKPMMQMALHPIFDT